MPKTKTNRGAAKRLQKTARGKLKRQHSNYTHIRTKKSPKRKRRLRKPTLVSKSDQKTMRRLLPYA